MTAMRGNFPVGAELDRLVLWAVAEIERISPDVEAWTSTVIFYTLREYDMEWACSERHYRALIERALDRLRARRLVTLDVHQGWRLRRMEAL
jgi:hypothetical protein